jgi:hypothetical protein
MNPGEPWLSQTASTLASVNWIEWVKAVGGPFIGAGLAFYASKKHDAHRREREDLAAGRLALDLMANQFSDCVQYRLGLRQSLAERAPNISVSAPTWVHAMFPLSFTFNEGLEVDLQSLGFVHQQMAEPESLHRLLHAQHRYLDLRNRAQQFFDAAVAVQRDLSAKVPHPPQTLADFLTVDLALARRALTALLGALHAVEDIDEPFETADASLRRAILNVYPKAVFPPKAKAPVKFALASLPPVPAVLAAMTVTNLGPEKITTAGVPGVSPESATR